MKKMICYFLVCTAILALIAGCVYNGTNEQSNPTLVATAPEVSGSHTEPSTPELTLPEKAPLPVAEREKIGELIDYDPDRELYILTGYNDCVYYLPFSGVAVHSFYIFSKNPLDLDSIHVDVPIQHPYTVSVKEKVMEGIVLPDDDSSGYRNTRFPYELYQCYQGKDFQKMAELKWDLEYWRAMNISQYHWLEDELITQDQANAINAQYYTALDAFESYRDAELEAYTSLKKEDIPQFYVYFVMIHFGLANIDHIPDETFTEIDVTIGGQVYKQQVGRITLKSGNLAVFDQRDWYNNGENVDDGIIGSGNYPLPYNDGIHTINTYFHIKADCYKTLTNLVLDSPAHQLEAVWIEIMPEGGSWHTYKWDLSEPFELYPGDDVIINVTYRDDCLADYLGYRTKLYGYLEYESDGKTWYKIAECSVDCTMNLYVLYALIFDGIDMESYYWDYYYLFEEAWRYDSTLCPFADDLPVVCD